MADFPIVCENYYVENIKLTSNFSEESFSILNVNCQSLRNKFSQFEQFLMSFEIFFDVICLTETWLNNELDFFKLDNYSFSGTQRKTRGGGAGIYVRDGLDVGVLPTVVLAGCDVHSVRVSFGDSSEPIVITSLYRQPSADVTLFLDDLEKFMSTSHASNYIIAGDFNIDFLNDSNDDYPNLLAAYCFTNTITIPTHHFKPSNKWTCLDHILTNIGVSTISSGTIYSDFSDHLPTFTFIHKYKKSTHSKFFQPNYHSFVDYENVRKLLQKVNWDTILTTDINTSYDSFLQKLHWSIDNCTEKRPQNFCRRQSTMKPWITKNLLAKIKNKYRLYRKLQCSPLNASLKRKYTKAQNELSMQLKAAKSSYFSQAFRNCNNPTQVWSLVNSEILKKPKQESRKLPSKLVCINAPMELALTDKEIANEFNSYFSSIGKQLALKFSDSGSLEQPTTYHTDTELYLPFQLKYTSNEEILKQISVIKPNKSSGIDQISAKFLKNMSNIIVYPLRFIINSSIDCSKVPEKMKIARVSPLYKRGSLDDCGNYRPISILPLFSKVMEKIVNRQILDHLETNKILKSNQFGFRCSKGYTHMMQFQLSLILR